MVLNFGRPKILVGFQFSSAYIVYIYNIYLKFWRYNSCIKICKMSHQIFYFLLFYTSLYISRHHFPQIFRILELRSTLPATARKIFVTNFPSLTDPLRNPRPHPLSSRNPLSVTKVFCQCSLNIVMEPGKGEKSFQGPFSSY